MRRAGIGRGKRIATAAGFAVPILLGATLGYFALRDAPDMATVSIRAITGGALTSVVVEEMIIGAPKGDTSHLGPVFLTAGFALFAAVSPYLG